MGQKLGAVRPEEIGSKNDSICCWTIGSHKLSKRKLHHKIGISDIEIAIEAFNEDVDSKSICIPIHSIEVDVDGGSVTLMRLFAKKCFARVPTVFWQSEWSVFIPIFDENDVTNVGIVSRIFDEGSWITKASCLYEDDSLLNTVRGMVSQIQRCYEPEVVEDGATPKEAVECSTREEAKTTTGRFLGLLFNVDDALSMCADGVQIFRVHLHTWLHCAVYRHSHTTIDWMSCSTAGCRRRWWQVPRGASLEWIPYDRSFTCHDMGYNCVYVSSAAANGDPSACVKEATTVPEVQAVLPTRELEQIERLQARIDEQLKQIERLQARIDELENIQNPNRVLEHSSPKAKFQDGGLVEQNSSSLCPVCDNPWINFSEEPALSVNGFSGTPSHLAERVIKDGNHEDCNLWWAQKLPPKKVLKVEIVGRRKSRKVMSRHLSIPAYLTRTVRYVVSGAISKMEILANVEEVETVNKWLNELFKKVRLQIERSKNARTSKQPLIIATSKMKAQLSSLAVKPAVAAWDRSAEFWPFRVYYPLLISLVDKMKEELRDNWPQHTLGYTRSAFLSRLLLCLTHGKAMWAHDGFFPETSKLVCSEMHEDSNSLEVTFVSATEDSGKEATLQDS